MSEEKTAAQLRREALTYEQKNGWDMLAEGEKTALETYCEDYKKFLDAGKTERECVDYTVRLAQANGFRAFERGMELKPGDKVYRVNRDKAMMLAVIGSEGLENGVNIGAAHIDSPRLDLKQTPCMRQVSWHS